MRMRTNCSTGKAVQNVRPHKEQERSSTTVPFFCFKQILRSLHACSYCPYLWTGAGPSGQHLVYEIACCLLLQCKATSARNYHDCDDSELHCTGRDSSFRIRLQYARHSRHPVQQFRHFGLMHRELLATPDQHRQCARAVRSGPFRTCSHARSHITSIHSGPSSASTFPYKLRRRHQPSDFARTSKPYSSNCDGWPSPC